MRFHCRTRRALLFVLFVGSAAAGPVLAAEMLTLEITRAASRLDERTKQPVIEIRLTDASKAAFANFTAGHLGEKTEFRFEGQVLMQSVVREPILGGTMQISGYTADEVRTIVGRLSSGTKIEVAVISN